MLNYISIHAPRVGSDHGILVSIERICYFNPRSPCGERLGLELPEYILLRISIHAPRVGSDGTGTYAYNFTPIISIHAPRVGSDISCLAVYNGTAKISIHAPRVGSDDIPENI